MRTTIEIPDSQRARLLELAARRGEKGFSSLVREALELYLRDQQRYHAVERAAGLRGCLSAEEAADLEAATARIRSQWR
jgi:metal-responsive CopG/Arc/MetJ family transcriptional regulator